MQSAEDSGDEFVTPQKKARVSKVERPETPAGKSITAMRSRFANSVAKRSLSDVLRNERSTRRTMARAEQKLLATKTLMYPDGVTAEMVQQHPMLERFVCWTSSISDGCGVSKSTTGASNPSGIYFKVSCGKDVKFQAHKLMLCQKLGVLYTEFNGRDLDASHLCHNRYCWKPSHLCSESHRENFDRNRCKGWILDSKAKRYVRMCRHDTPCEFVTVVSEDWTPL